MKKSEECIEEQLELIKDISAIIDNQISDIFNMGKSVTISDPAENLKRGSRLLMPQLYLKFFKDIVIFLLDKLKEEKEENFRFFLPNIRTLLDIYGQLLYFCNEDENKQASIYIANALFTLSHTIGNPSEIHSELEKQAYEDVKKSYDKNYKYYKSFLDRERINIPEDMKLFSKKILSEKLKLSFPPLPEILKKGTIEASSPETTKFYPTISRHIYRTFRYTSNYIHGNILSAGIHGNEKLWIIAEVQTLSSLVADLINTKILGNSRKTELIEWLKDFFQKKPKFINFWQERNKNT